MVNPVDVIDFQVEADSSCGPSDAFLSVRRVTLRNLRADGTTSRPFTCEFVERPQGTDAVVVALYHRPRGGRVLVLLRDGLRPPLRFGRAGPGVPIADARQYLRFSEVVAGIVERDDRGEAGIRRRAATEVAEEAGFEVAAADVEFLGAGTFPSPGSMPEKYWLVAAEVLDPGAGSVPSGDGSPFEEGARLRWVELDAAIAAAVAGEIEDAKTELALRRLRDRLVPAACAESATLGP